jgi:hypothetical protein
MFRVRATRLLAIAWLINSRMTSSRGVNMTDAECCAVCPAYSQLCGCWGSYYCRMLSRASPGYGGGEACLE